MKTQQPETTKPATRTAAEARQWLIDHGVTLKEFADHHGLSFYGVTNALYRGQYRRGHSYKAALALGIIPRPNGESPLANPLEAAHEPPQ